MRIAPIVFVVLLLLPGAVTAEEPQFRLTGTYQVFSTTDEDVAKRHAEEFPKIDLSIGSKALDSIARQTDRTEHESLSAVVRVDQAFELTKKEGNITFSVTGIIKQGPPGRAVIDVIPKYRVEIKDPAFPADRPSVRERWVSIAAEPPLDTDIVVGSLISERRSGDGKAEYQYAFYTLRVDALPSKEKE